MSGNLYLPVRATIEDIVEETTNIKTFVIKPEQPIPFQAGQFIELTVPGLGEAPFTPSSSPAESERMEITIMRVGKVTERLHALEPGAEVGLRGPLGTPYPLDKYHGREILIVGGGVGLAPLRALLFALFQDLDKFGKILLRYGARSPGDLVYRDALMDAWGKADCLDIAVTVDEGGNGWSGHEGVVTTILEPNTLPCNPSDGIAVVCGPPIMMKFTTLKLLERGYPEENIYLSMEKNMSCGVGKCGHCRLEDYYACKDGPVLTYAQVKSSPRIWD